MIDDEFSDSLGSCCIIKHPVGLFINIDLKILQRCNSLATIFYCIVDTGKALFPILREGFAAGHVRLLETTSPWNHGT